MRTTLKRQRDVFDSPPASSTPPQRASKRVHREPDSDTSSIFASPSHVPSDSPSNPFGRFKTFAPRGLPHPTPITDHLILRFQLGQPGRNIFRIASVPTNYTFWHLARLTQFLYGWKSTRKERSPHNKHKKIDRKCDHIFTVQKRVQFYPPGKNPGLFKGGNSTLRVASNIKELKPLCENEEIPWEREEAYTLHHLWHRPGSTSDLSRAVIFEYDILSPRKESVYISIVDEDKLHHALLDAYPESDDSSNTPVVLQGQGLPDDDDDDDDFALDLQQWNEDDAFEKYIISQGGYENKEDEEEDDESLQERLSKEQELVRKRMKAPLPKVLPVDEDDFPEVDDQDGEAPSRVSLSSLPTAAESLATLGKKQTQPTDKDEKPVMPKAESTDTLGRSPLKKRSSNTDDAFVAPNAKPSMLAGIRREAARPVTTSSKSKPVFARPTDLCERLEEKAKSKDSAHSEARHSKTANMSNGQMPTPANSSSPVKKLGSLDTEDDENEDEDDAEAEEEEETRADPRVNAKAVEKKDAKVAKEAHAEADAEGEEDEEDEEDQLDDSEAEL